MRDHYFIKYENWQHVFGLIENVAAPFTEKGLRVEIARLEHYKITLRVHGQVQGNFFQIEIMNNEIGTWEDRDIDWALWTKENCTITTGHMSIVSGLPKGGS